METLGTGPFISPSSPGQGSSLVVDHKVSDIHSYDLFPGGNFEDWGGGDPSPSPGLGSSLVGARDRARQLPRTDWT